MEDGLFTNQGKKLLFIALLLIGVAMLVGGEDDPGVLAEVQQEPPLAGGEPPEFASAPAPAPAPPPAQSAAPQPAPTPTPAATVPVTGEELIDSAQGFDPAPMLDPTPQV